MDVNVAEVRHALNVQNGTFCIVINRPDAPIPWRLNVIRDSRIKALREGVWMFQTLENPLSTTSGRVFLKDDEVIGYLMEYGLMDRETIVAEFQKAVASEFSLQWSRIFPDELKNKLADYFKERSHDILA